MKKRRRINKSRLFLILIALASIACLIHIFYEMLASVLSVMTFKEFINL